MEKFHTVLVIGDNPQAQMSIFDKSIHVSPHVIFEKEKMGVYRKQMISFFEHVLKEPQKMSLSEAQATMIKRKVEYLNSITDLEYFESLIENNRLDENGNIVSTENPYGKWSFYQNGGNQSMLLFDKDGKSHSSLQKGEVDWSKTHLSNINTFNRVWEMIIDGDEPKNATDKVIYGNMVNQLDYLKNFQSKEHYAHYNSAFWCYALVQNEKWMDIDNGEDKWVENFYDRFIKDLDDTTLLTIYEFRS